MPYSHVGGAWLLLPQSHDIAPLCGAAGNQPFPSSISPSLSPNKNHSHYMQVEEEPSEGAAATPTEGTEVCEGGGHLCRRTAPFKDDL